MKTESKIEKIKTIFLDSSIPESQKIKQFLQNDGKISAAVLRYFGSSIKDYPIYAWVMENTKEIDVFSKDISFSMRLAYLLDREHSKIDFCSKCGKPFLVFSRLQKSYRLCRHKQSKIDYSRLANNRIKKTIEDFNAYLDNSKLILSDLDFDRMTSLLEEKTKKDNFKISICYPYFAYIHDLIYRTQKLIPINKTNLRINERFYLLLNKMTEVPKCEICHENEVVFLNRKDGYKKTCKKCYKLNFQNIWAIKNKETIDRLINKDKYEVVEYPKAVTSSLLTIYCKQCGKTSEIRINCGRLNNLDNVLLCKHCERPHCEENEVFDFVSSICSSKIVHEENSRK